MGEGVVALLILNLGICLEVNFSHNHGKCSLSVREVGECGSQSRCERLAEQITDAMWDRTRNAYS
jgi:hypothetical protein